MSNNKENTAMYFKYLSTASSSSSLLTHPVFCKVSFCVSVQDYVGGHLGFGTEPAFTIFHLRMLQWCYVPYFIEIGQ